MSEKPNVKILPSQKITTGTMLYR